MAYSTPEDAGRQFGVVFTANTTPTTSQVEAFIAEIDAQINAHLRKHGFDVTYNKDLPNQDSYLRGLSAVGGAYKAARAYFTGQGYNEAPVVAELRDEYNARLSSLAADPSLVLNTSDMSVVRFVGKPNSETPAGYNRNAAPVATMERQF